MRKRSEAFDDEIDRAAQGVCGSGGLRSEPRKYFIAIVDGKPAAGSDGRGTGFGRGAVGVSLLLAAIPEPILQSMPYLRDAGIKVPVLGFLCGVTVLTAIIFGLAPGLTIARGSLNEALEDETRGGTSTAQARLRRTLVVAEISVALVLLVGAGLMLKSVRGEPADSKLSRGQG